MVKEKMNYEEFRQEVAQEIRKRIPQAEVDVKEVKKNNGTVHHGIIIIEKDAKSNMFPTIYLESFYDSYSEGKKTVEETADEIIEINNKHRVESNFDASSLQQFENVRNKLRIKLVNTKENQEFLNGVPHKEFLDLSAIYQITVFDVRGTGTININNEMFEKYGITVDELHEAALNNMKDTEPVKIQGMTQLLEEMLGDVNKKFGDVFGEGEMPDIEDCPMDKEMFIITNERKIFGASVILHKETLSEIAGIFNNDYYIIPSSVHECIAVNATKDVDVEGLRSMVSEVNVTQVIPEEVLSFNVYRYSIGTGELSIA